MANVRRAPLDHDGRVRVVHVINTLGAGGAERSLAESLPRLRARGVDSSIVTLDSWSDGVADDVASSGVDVHRLREGSIPLQAWRLRRHLCEVRPHLVHTTLFDADIVGRVAAIGLAPVVSSIVNTSYDQVRLADPNIRRVRLLGARLIDGFTARHLTAHVHAISDAVAASAVETLGIDRDRVTVIHRGRDDARLGRRTAARRLAARRSLGIADGAQVVVHLGRQEFQKAHDVLLEAFAEVARARPATVLLLVGRTGNASAAIAAAIDQEGLHDRVRQLAFRHDVGDVLAASDLFVFPSRFEGLGGSLIEAMALSLPVVASDLPAVREVVDPGVTGDLVPVGDARSLAAAICQLLDDEPRRIAYGDAGRRRFEERFTVEVEVERLAALYRAVATRRA